MAMNRNHLKIVVVTASDSRLIESDIYRLAWSHHIHLVLGSNVLPGDKSDSDFARAVESMTQEAGFVSIAMIGNSLADRHLARNLGLRFYGVPSSTSDWNELRAHRMETGCLYGSLFDVTKAITEEMSANGDLYT